MTLIAGATDGITSPVKTFSDLVYADVNQGDAVSIVRIAKTRLIASRWPKDVPVIGAPVLLSERAGVPLSRNEA